MRRVRKKINFSVRCEDIACPIYNTVYFCVSYTSMELKKQTIWGGTSSYGLKVWPKIHAGVFSCGIGAWGPRKRVWPKIHADVFSCRIGAWGPRKRKGGSVSWRVDVARCVVTHNSQRFKGCNPRPSPTFQKSSNFCKSTRDKHVIRCKLNIL